MLVIYLNTFDGITVTLVNKQQQKLLEDKNLEKKSRLFLNLAHINVLHFFSCRFFAYEP